MTVRNYARPGSAPLVSPGTPGSTGGTLGSVTDGVTTVSPVTSIDFTSGATVTDGGGGVADVAVTGGGSLAIDHNGTLVGTRSTLNLIDGSNVTLTVTDNAGAGRVDVTIASTGGGGGGVGGSLALFHSVR